MRPDTLVCRMPVNIAITHQKAGNILKKSSVNGNGGGESKIIAPNKPIDPRKPEAPPKGVYKSYPPSGSRRKPGAKKKEYTYSRPLPGVLKSAEDNGEGDK